MSDIKAMMQAAKDKEAEVKAKFDEFDVSNQSRRLIRNEDR